RVEGHVVHEVGDDLALVVTVEQRALELVACRQQHDRLAGPLEFAPALVDRRLEAGDAAETLAGGFTFGVAGRVRTGDRLETGVEIVDVQNVEGELSLRWRREPGGQCQRRGAEQISFHVPVPLLESSSGSCPTVMRQFDCGLRCKPLPVRRHGGTMSKHQNWGAGKGGGPFLRERKFTHYKP